MKFAFGHDEYVYQMPKFNQAKFPQQALDMVRLHSCYPWYTGGEYDHLMKEADKETKQWISGSRYSITSNANYLGSRRQGGGEALAC